MATIVLVEDTDQVRVLTQSYLEQDGHQVLSAGTPGGAIAILQRTEGVDLAADAKHIHPNLKVLYTTSRAQTDGMKARFIEGSAFLQKPYTVERLQHVLMAHFRIKPNAK